MGVAASLVTAPIDAPAELAAFLAEAAGVGAVVSFCGVARPAGKDGSPVDALHLEHHPRMTGPSLQAIAEAGARRFATGHVRVVHRCGAVRAGETIVFVAAASAHRRAAFDAADYVMDRLKTDALFWKREEGPGTSRWIEPSEDDRLDRARWGE